LSILAVSKPTWLFDFALCNSGVAVRWGADREQATLFPECLQDSIVNRRWELHADSQPLSKSRIEAIRTSSAGTF
jgi:hypothetical protein